MKYRRAAVLFEVGLQLVGLMRDLMARTLLLRMVRLTGLAR